MHYDPLGRLIRTDLPDKTHTRVEFSPWEQKVFDQNDTLTTSSDWYSDRNVVSPADDEEAGDKDAAIKALVHSDTPTLTRFDSLGRPYEVEQDDGTDTLTTKSELDVEGLVLTVTDANGRTCMSYTYGPLGQVLALSSLDAGDRWMLDGATGQPVRAGGERGFTQRVTYDALRRPTAVYVDDGSVEDMVQEMVYGESTTLPASQNVLGKLVELYDQSGKVVTDDFDFKGNPLIQKRQYADDVKNRLDWGATTPPTLLSETWQHEFVYDALNRPTSTTYPDDTEVIPTFDAGGMLESVEARLRGASTSTTIVESITYDEKGRRERIVYSDSSGDHVYTDYTYDPLTYRLQHFKTTRSSDSKLLQSLAYHYDAVGNITRTRDTATKTAFFDSGITVPDVDGDYTYDAFYRLISAKGREHQAVIGQLDDSQMAAKTTIPLASDPNGLHEYTRTYAYDDVGNITSLQSSPVGGTSWTRTYTYVSGTNQLSTTRVSGGTVSYTHDLHGNITVMPHLDTIEWDYADQMRRVDKSTGAGQETWFVYDSSGQRVRKVYEHNGVREERLYLGGCEVYRKSLTSTGVVQDERETVHLSDDHRRVCMAETKTVTGASPVGSPTTYLRYQLDNHLGTCAVEVEADGAVVSYEEYHPYGTSAYRAQRGTLDVSAKRYRYTGKERDEETGLYYHGARYYAPWLGRWTAADPLAFADGTGGYTYARNEPTNLSDPSGRQVQNYGTGEVETQRQILERWAPIVEMVKEDNPELLSFTLLQISAELELAGHRSDMLTEAPPHDGPAVSTAPKPTPPPKKTAAERGRANMLTGGGAALMGGAMVFSGGTLAPLIGAIMLVGGTTELAVGTAQTIGAASGDVTDEGAAKADEVLEGPVKAVSSPTGLATTVGLMLAGQDADSALQGGAILAEVESFSLEMAALGPRTPSGTRAPIGGSMGTDGTPRPPPPDNAVFSGHAYWRPEMGITRVPEGTTVTTWGAPGDTISISFGRRLDRRQIPTRAARKREGARTYLPGSEIPNYRLLSPSQGHPFTPGRDAYFLEGVDGAAQLNQLLRPNMGHCVWSACLHIPADVPFAYRTP